MRRYEGRVALVTAAAQGIGRATALRLASEGAAVAVTDVRRDGAEAVAGEIDGEAIGLECDVTSTSSVQAAVAATVERFGRLDLVVNNAGGCVVSTPFAENDGDAWHQQLDLSLVGAARCIRAALPHLLESRGNVVTIGSVNGLGAFGNVEYSAAKAGLQNLVKNLTGRYGPDGVRFNVVAPGTIRTPNWDGAEDWLDTFAKSYPLRRVGEPEDIAAAVAFLGSDDAAWISGITLPVEGGILTGPPGLNTDHW
jgi:meso-butanediol dehydrogenase / (S,S)-butanediol dehydrogenase / diacetyl reductase